MTNPYTPEKVAELVAELQGFAAGSESARATLMRDAADTLESVYADSLTAQAEHARWQERAEKAERAGERILADALARSAELRKERERAAALAEQGTEEPEWEYGNEMLLNTQTVVHPASSETLAKAQAWLWPMYRRRKAGPWLPVEQGNEDA